MLRTIFLLLLISIFTTGSSQLPTPKVSVEGIIPPTREKIKLDHLLQLQTAQKVGSRSSFSLSLPMRGVDYTFIATPNDVIDDEFRRNFPDILTFDIVCQSDASINGALTLSSVGLYATILNSGKMVSIYPENVNQASMHIIEYGVQPDLPRPAQTCGHDHSIDRAIKNPTSFGSRVGINIGEKRYNYRVAIVATGEFYIKNGNNDNAVRTVVVNSVNGISAIFNNELSFKLTVGSRIYIGYTDPNTDPFIPDEAGGSNRPTQAGIQVPIRFAASTFDIGHVFHQHEDGDGWGNGGIAQLRSVCNNQEFGGVLSKASGWSGAYTNEGNGWIQLATHEFGHQFGANHTFNGIGSSCTSAIREVNSYEIGSGTTIMSYNGICDSPQNIPSADALDNYFHIKSLEEMATYVYDGTGGTCGSPTTSSNPLPSVTANPCGANYRIPKGTPFYLNATGEATDGDVHSYCWEQIDEDGAGTPTQGFIGTTAANSSIAPLFRSYPPTSVSERYFPSLSILASGASDPFDVLPNVARTLHFNVSMRDNNPSGGAVANDDISVAVNTAGPFVITRPKGGEVLQAGQMETLTWNTNGTNALCSKIRIKLSNDGGFTYPQILAENIDYAAGTFSYSIPSNIVLTSKARIMMECMDYECFKFFNVSAANFTINSTCTPETSVVCPVTNVSLDEGVAGLNLSMSKVIGNPFVNVSRVLTDQSPIGSVAVKGEGGVGCAVSSTYYYEKASFYVTESGSYTFTVNGSGFATILRSTFNPNSPCSSFITSTATDTGGGISRSTTMTANLTQCTEYVIAYYTFSTLPQTLSISVTNGPGIIVERNTMPSTNYQNVFVVVNDDTDEIVLMGNTTDLTTTVAGKYTIYSVVLDATADIATYVGKTYAELKTSECLNESLNSRKVEIKSSCKISNITASTQGSCEPALNYYTQNLILTYDKAPTNGKLRVNGQDFDITGSPQTITLINLDSDGAAVDVNAYFTASPNCKLDIPAAFIAPPNCCPVVVSLGDDMDMCEGETVTLDAGDTGTSYRWFKDGVEIMIVTKTLTVNTSGLYEVEVTHSSGCKKRDNITINFIAKPVVTLPATVTFCEGETYILSIMPGLQANESISWFKDGVIIPGEEMGDIQIASSGTYLALVFNQLDCTTEVSTIVESTPAPVVELGPDQNKCESETVTLDAGNQGTTYTWFKDGVVISGANQSTFVPLQSGIYRVLVSNAALCQTEDAVNIKYFASPVVSDLPPLINACQGTSAMITVQASDYETLQWKYDGNPITGSNGLSLTVNNSGTYSIEAVNNIGCTTIKSTQVEVRSLPVVNLGSAIVSCIGSEVVLNAGNEGETYTWKKDGVTLSNSMSTLAVDQSGLYQVTVTNTFNCSTVDEVNISFVSGPTLDIGGDATICEGDSYFITATTSAPNATIRWFKNGELITGQNDFSIAVTQAGEYEAVVNGGTPPCDVRKKVNVTVNPRPGVNLMNDRTLCEGEPFPVLDGGANQTSYAWTFNGAPIATTRTVTADQSGTYSVTVKNSFNCENKDDVKITIVPIPTLTLEATYSLCDGQQVDIQADSDGTSFEWRKEGTVIADEVDKTISVSEGGLYSCEATNAGNCTVLATFEVVSRPSPIIELGADITLCPQESISLDPGVHSSYNWSDGSSGNSLLVNAGAPSTLVTNQYFVTVGNEFGCQSKDSVTITLNPVVKASLTADMPGVCNGEPVTLTASGGFEYTWLDPSGSLSTTVGSVTIASPTVTTTYTVEVSDQECPNSIDTKTIEIKVFEPVDISAGNDTCMIIGRNIKLNARGGVAYQWDNVGLIQGPSNIANPIVSPAVETIFTVTITDVNGCEFTDEVKVCIIEDPLSLFKAVSIITPNGDGLNDDLYFAGLEAFPENSLKIFNRWGNLIFEQEGYQSRGYIFDGLRNGDRLPADTYYYVLIFEDQVIKSSLTILWD